MHVPYRCDIFKVQKGHNCEKLTKRPETQTCSVPDHNKGMPQVSVEYVKGYGEKKSGKPQVGRMDAQMDRWTD